MTTATIVVLYVVALYFLLLASLCETQNLRSHLMFKFVPLVLGMSSGVLATLILMG
jgi:hypothetical protein